MISGEESVERSNPLRAGGSLRILVAGGSGFIGRRLVQALVEEGHQVSCAQRTPPSPPARHVPADFARDLAAADWLPRLADVEVVINAVGILREHGESTFERVHTRAPQALFEACAQAGVKLVVQISALGADDAATSRYHRSKKAADDYLAQRNIAAYIVQPSLVYGAGGASAHLFDTMAALPVLVVPGRSAQCVQPVLVDDLVAVVVRMVRRAGSALRGVERVPIVGPEPLALREFLRRLRATLGLARTVTIPVPIGVVRAAARLGELTGRGLLDRETLAMLERGNTADVGATRAWLGRAPTPVEEFIARDRRADARTAALLGWLLPLLRFSVAAVWIVTGVLSLGVYPVEESYALLARTGVSGPLAPIMLYGAAALDLALGVGVLVLRPSPRVWLWIAQIALMVGYTIIITWKLPEFWLHPYGPVLKNVPLLAAIVLLLYLEPRRR